MSREEERNPYKRLRTDSNYSLNNSRLHSNVAYLASSDAQTSTTRNVSRTPYGNIIPDVQRRNSDILSNSKSCIHIANMPIFEDPQELGMLHRNFNPSFSNETVATSSKMLHNNKSSSALEALQNYGPRVHFPTHFSSNTDVEKLNITNMLSSSPRSLQSSSEPRFDHVHDPESSTTPTGPSSRSFNDLNYLKSVEDEDDFLYGNSNSLPDEPKSAMEVSSKMKDERHDVDWSDDDFDVSGTSQNKFNSRNRKTSSVWDIQNKNVETKNITQSWQVEKVGNFASEKLVSKKISLEQLNCLTQNSSVLSRDTKSMGKKRLDVIGDILQGTPGYKPKYHMAAQLLKKKTLNSPANKSSSNEKLCGFAETNIENKVISKSTLSKNPKISEKGSSELKTEKASTKTARLLPKDLEHIKDYIRPHSKDHSKEEYQLDNRHTKHEIARHSSPERHHSPYDSRYKSLDDPRHRSLYLEKHKSPERDLRLQLSSYHSRHRSSNVEYERYLYEHGSSRHQNYEGHRRHSRSPVRRSREKSPGYRRYKARSPGLRRSRERVRSPSYERRHEYKRKKSSSKFSNSPDRHYSKTCKKSEDNSSFCSLSLGSSSDSSESSSSEEKEKSTSKSKQCPQSKVNKDETNKIAVVKPKEGFDIVPDKSDAASFFSEDISKSLFEASKPIINEEEFFNIFKIMEHSKRLYEVYEEEQEGNSSLISPIPIVENPTDNAQTLAPSSLQMPVISQSYSYPTMSSAPMPYCPPAVSDFSSVIPPSPFSSHPVMPPVPSMYVDPYTTSTFPRVDHSKKIECRTPKHIRGPATLINIELDPCSSVPKSTIKPSDLKVDTPVPPSPVKANSEQNNVIIQEYKKMKYERHLAQCKVKNSTEDVIELRGMMQEVWGKKVNASEKIFHAQCKTLLTTFGANVKYFVKEAKRLKEELDKFKAKQSPELQQELVKIKYEDYNEVNSTETYIVADSNNHVCYPCNKQFSSILSYVEHIPTLQHKEQSASDNKWLEHFKKEQKLDEKKRGACELVQTKGIEFLKSLTGFYCALCKETILDSRSAEQHLLSHDHYVKYKNFLQFHPLYPKKCGFKQLIEYSDIMKQRRKEREAKEKNLAAERRRKEDIDVQKVKEMIKNEHSKEIKLEELEVDSDDSDSENQKLTNIKSTVSGDKAKEKSQSSKGTKAKEIQKIVYIGKAPNFKKPLEQKSKPWYKRENILSKSAEDANSTKSSHAINIKTKPKSSECVEKSSVSKNELNSSNTLGNNSSKSQQIHKTAGIAKKTSEMSVKYTCLTEDEAKHTNDVKSSNIKNNIMSIPKSKDSVVNQAIKNILLGTASANRDVSLSEITIPKIVSSQNPNASSQSTLQSKSGNAPVPMDIDNSQDSKPNLRLATEEEKDLFILGINKDDLKPLVIPVPPPSYSNASTILSSNAVCDLAFTKNITDVKSFDFSIPPPTMPPYSRNAPPPPYSNKNSQSSLPFPNPSNVMSLPTFPNTNNTSMYPFSNHSMSQTMSAFSSSNISNQPHYNQYHNQYSIASNIPSTFPNQTHTPFLPKNVSYDSSLIKGHLNFNAGGSKSIPATHANLQTKASLKKQVSESKQDGRELKQDVRNLITIVPKEELSELLSKPDNLKKESAVIENNGSTEENVKTKSTTFQELSNKDVCLKGQNAQNNMESSNSDLQEKTSSQDLKTSDSKEIISLNAFINTNANENIKDVGTIIISSQELPSNKDACLKKQNAESKMESFTSDPQDIKSCEDIRFLDDSINTNVEKIEEVETRIISSQELLSNKDACLKKQNTESNMESSTSDPQEKTNSQNLKISDSKDIISLSDSINANVVKIEDVEIKNTHELLTSRDICFKEKNDESNVKSSTLDLQAKDSSQDLKSCDMKEIRTLHDSEIPNVDEKSKDIETKNTTSQELLSNKNVCLKKQNDESNIGSYALDLQEKNSLADIINPNVDEKIEKHGMKMNPFAKSSVIEKQTVEKNLEMCVNAFIKTSSTNDSNEIFRASETNVGFSTVCETATIFSTIDQPNDENSEHSILEPCQEVAIQDQKICKTMIVENSQDKSLDNSIDTEVQFKNLENPSESPILEQCQEMGTQNQNICEAMVVDDSKDTGSLDNSIDTNVQLKKLENPSEPPILEQCQEMAMQDSSICEAMAVEDSKGVIRSLDNSIDTNIQFKNLENSSESSILEQCQEMATQNQNICEAMVVDDSKGVRSLDNSIDTNVQLKKLENLSEPPILEQCQEMAMQDQNICEAMAVEDSKGVISLDNSIDTNVPLKNLENPSEPPILEQCKKMAMHDQSICEAIVVEDNKEVRSSDNSINLNVHLKNCEPLVLEEYQEVAVQNQNISESIEIEDQNCIDGGEKPLDQILNYSVSNLGESMVDDEKRASYKLEVKPQMEIQTFSPVISLESDINNDNVNICVEDLDKLPEEKIVGNCENISSEENQDLVQEQENSLVKEFETQKKEQESNIQHGNPQNDTTSSQTFADISSSLEKLEKVVSEFNSLPELQVLVKEADASEIPKLSSVLVKEADASEIPKLSSDIKKIENAVENDNLLDIEKTGSVMENENLPKPGKSKNDSDTDEYEDNEA